MAKKRILAAIELGSSKISTLIAHAQVEPSTSETSINIIGVSVVPSKGVRKGQIVDIEEVVDAMISSVEPAERMAGYNLDSAFLALNGGHLSSQNSHGVVAISDPDGEISVDDVERVVDAASAVSIPSSREVVHIIPQEFVVDGESHVLDPVGMSGVRLEVNTHLVTASSAAIKNVRRVANEVGVETEGLVFSGIAAAEAVLTSTEKELGCVLVDIGGGTTSYVAYIEGSVAYSGVIPIGAKNVTNDLAIGLRVPLESAEKIKLMLSKKRRKDSKVSHKDKINFKEVGIEEIKNVSVKTLTDGIIKPRLNEVFTMVRMELERAEIANKVPSGVVISGGGAETVGTTDSARRVLALPVRIGKPKGVGGLIDDIISPDFATPIGLILHGAKEEPREGFSSITKKMKFPGKGVFRKFIETVKNLLP
jgi:cell division protein FtsA